MRLSDFATPPAIWMCRMVALALALAGLTCASAKAHGDEPTAIVDTGAVTGIALSPTVDAWLGIPFAAPPVRDARWRPPQKLQRWTRTYRADRIGPECFQPMREHAYNHYFGDEPMSEDCLYLNVWAPATRTAGADPVAKKPVIVWIYGGSFVVGSGGKALYDGQALAAKGAVVVTVNYRLGALGFLAHPELSAESPQHASGNYGLLDQIAALQWVQRNIAAFGGDPKRVTLMGQSAGAIAISDLQVSPLARGLFDRIVALSGSALAPAFDTPPLADAEKTGQAFAASLGTPSLAALRRMPADAISRAAFAGARPIVDGWVLPDRPANLYAAGRQLDVPLMLGFTRDENLTSFAAVRTLADYRAETERQFGANAAKVEALYPSTDDAGARQAANMLGRDISFSPMMRTWAKMQGEHGRAPTWAYMFAQPHPYVPGVRFTDMDTAAAGIYHTAEVPYFLGNFDAFNLFRATRQWTADDRLLADRMMTSLVAFASSGDPGQFAGLIWPRYDARERLMIFAEPPAIAVWPNRAELDALAAMRAKM